MTYKEARKDIIESGIELGGGDYVELEALRVAVEALDKQIPKAPQMKAYPGFDPDVASHLACPTCGEGVTNYWAPGTKPKHCQFCGQALDWGEEAKR